jgi:hypothetical protein
MREFFPEKAIVPLRKKTLEKMRALIYRYHVLLVAIIKWNQEKYIGESLGVNFLKNRDISVEPVIENDYQTRFGHIGRQK